MLGPWVADTQTSCPEDYRVSDMKNHRIGQLGFNKKNMKLHFGGYNLVIIPMKLVKFGEFGSIVITIFYV